MLARFAGRLLTSGLAFLLAGLIDFFAFWISWARKRGLASLGVRGAVPPRPDGAARPQGRRAQPGP